ncbi:MAG: type I restriction enzyme HsdR N-terminal domain-containing protein [Ferruginibacter sp.]
MIKIEYPDKKPAIKKENGKEYIFCLIRKRWFIITPEEWVRQNFLLYLVEVLKYPASLIAVEKQLQLSDIKKRFDIVVYKDALPFMIIECKEMNVPLSENTMLQVLNYNSGIQAEYMVITNGSYCILYKKLNGSFIDASAMPAFI